MNMFKQSPDLFRQQDLQALLDHHNEPCVSIYMASERKSADIRPIVFELGQLLDQAESKLADAGYRISEIEHLLRPARQLLTGLRTPFWQHQSEGLALFLCADGEFVYRLPLHFAQQVHVGNRFYIRPLIPLLSGDGRFYILALSENQVRLFQATRFTVDQIALRDTPQSFAESLRFDEFEKQLQQHSTSSSGLGRGRRAAVFHGQGSVGDAASTKTYLMHFLHKVDAEVIAILGEQTAPVVLAGVKGIQGSYRKLSRCQYLVEHGISGSPDRMNVWDLHSRAWALVAPLFQQTKTEAIERFHRLHNKGDLRAIDNAKHILLSARDKQVETLLVSVEAQVWGSFDPLNGELIMHRAAQLSNEDLLNLAVHYTLSNGGMVYALDAKEMPSGLDMAAILRY